MFGAFIGALLTLGLAFLAGYHYHKKVSSEKSKVGSGSSSTENISGGEAAKQG